MEYKISKVDEKNLKRSYVNDIGQYSDDFINELISSDFFALLIEDKCCGLATVVENNNICGRISHFIIDKQLLKTNVSIELYLELEKYCLKKNYEMIVVEFPANIRGMTGFMRKFFKKVGFKKECKKISHEGNFVFLIKDKIKNWYSEKNGELIPNIQDMDK